MIITRIYESLPVVLLDITSSILTEVSACPRGPIVRDSSVVRRHYIFLLEPSDVRAQYIYGKQLICLTSSMSAHFHVSWLSDFINYQKPLYKSLHQSFFYSFITILPSEFFFDNCWSKLIFKHHNYFVKYHERTKQRY